MQTTSVGHALPHRRADAHWAVTQLCFHPCSIAEISAHLTVPLGVARVLVGDLVSEGLVVVQATVTDDTDADERRDLIERVLNGLRAR